MSSVDKRIVEMQFNNKQFEAGAKETMDTLNKLDKSLQFDNSGIAKGIDFLANKFTTLGTIGRRALENITDSVMNAGKSLVNDFFVAPRTQGFDEYELKMGSIQTIINSVKDDFNSEAEALEYVGGRLDKLNEYADKTKYSFSQATSSIGKFTNAGVKLDDAVDAIQGILNLAGVSGAGAQQANSAMYNFAQALGTGFLGLMDWKSIELANMSTIEFQEELIKTGLEMGTLVEEEGKFISTTTDASGAISDAFKAGEGFRDSLSHQWVTSQVLTETLKQYTDTTTELGKKATEATTKIFKFTEMMGALKETVGSGWAKTWELIVGDYGEAATLWTGVYRHFNTILDKQAENRNALLQTWRDEYNGAMELKKLLNIIYNTAMSVVNPIKKAFQNVFPPMTAKNLADIIDGLQEFFKTIRLNDSAQYVVQKLFEGIFSGAKFAFSMLKPVVAVLKGVFNLLKPVIDLLATIWEQITNIIQGIFVGITGDKNIDAIAVITQGIANAFTWLVEKLTSAVNSLKKLFGSAESAAETGKKIGKGLRDFFTGISSNVQNAWNGIGGFEGIGAKVKEIFNNLGASFKTGTDQIGGWFANVGAAFSEGWGKVVDWFKNLGAQFKDYNFGTALDFINLGAIVALFVKVNSITNQVKDATKAFKELSKGLKDIVKGVASVLQNVAGVLKAYAQNLKAEAFLKLAAGIALLVAALVALTLVDQNALHTAIQAMVILIGTLAIFVAVMNSGNTIASGLASISKGLGGMMAGTKLVLMGTGLLMIVAALGALLGVIKLYASVDIFELGNGLFKLFSTLVLIGGTVTVFSLMLEKSSKSLLAFGFALGAIAVSMTILAGAIALFQLIPWDAMGKAGATFGVFILGVVGSILLLQRVPARQIKNIADGFVKMAGAFTILALAMNLLVPALIAFTMIAKFGGWEGFGLMAATLGVLSASLVVLAVAVKIMGESAKYLGNIALGLGLLTIAITAIALVAPIIIASADQIKAALIALVKIVCDVITETAGPVIKALLTLLNETLKALDEYLPTMIDSLLDMLVKILNGVADYTPEIVKELYRIIKGVVDGLKEAMGNVAPDEKTLVTMGLTVTGVLFLIREMAKMKGSLKDAGKTLVFMLILMAGVTAVFYAMNQAGITDGNTTEQAIGIGIVLMALATTMKYMGKQRGTMKAAGPALLAMVTAVGAMFAVIGAFQLMKDLDANTMIKQSIAIGIAMLALSATIKSMKGMSTGLDASAGVFIEIVAIIGVIGMLAAVFKELNGVDGANMIGQAISIGAVVVAIGFAVKMMGRVKGKADDMLAATLLIEGFIPVIFAIAGAFEIMNSAALDGKKMTSQAIALGIVLVAIGFAAKIAGQNKQNLEQAAGTAGLLVVFGAIAYELSDKVFKQIKDLDGVKMIAQATALGLIIDALAVAAWIAGKNRQSFTDALGTDILLAGFAAIIGELVFVFTALQGVDGNAMIPQAVAIGILLDMLSIAAAIAGKGVTSFTAAAGAALSILAFKDTINGIYGMFIDLKDVDGEQMILQATAMGELMDLLSIAAVIVSKIPFSGAVAGAAGFDAFAILITGLFALLGEIAPYIGDYVEGGLDLFTTILSGIGEAIGGFIGGLVGNAMTELSKSLPTIGQNLTDFMANAAPFFKACEGMTEETAAGAGRIAAVLIAFMGVELLDAINGFLDFLLPGDSSLASITAELNDAAPNIAAFCKQFNDVPADSVDKAAIAGQAIASLCNALPHEGGLQSIINGSVDFDALFNKDESGKSLFGKIGEALYEFQEASKGVDKDTVQMAVDAGKVIASLCDVLPKVGGVKQFIEGTSDMEGFSNNVPYIGKAIRRFKEEAGDITKEQVESGVEAGKLIAGLAETLPKANGIWQAMAGGVDYVGFAANMGDVGAAIAAFKNKAGSITTADVSNGVNAGKLLAKFATELTNQSGTGSIGQWFATTFATGTFKYDQFKKDMSTMADTLVYFTEKTREIKTEDVLNAQTAGELMVKFRKSLNDEYGTNVFEDLANNLFGGTFKIDEFSSDLITLANGILEFSNISSGVDVAQADNITRVVNDLIALTESAKDVKTNSFDNFNKAMRNLAAEGLNNFTNEFDSADLLINTSLSNMFTKVRTAIETYGDGPKTALNTFTTDLTGIIGGIDWYGEGNTLMVKFENGMLDQGDKVIESASAIVLGVEIEFKSKDSEATLKRAGSWVPARIADGITDKLAKATATIRGLFEQLIGVCSSFNPRWVNIGQGIAKGVAAGMSISRRLVNSKAMELAKEAYNTMKKTLDIHSPSKKTRELGRFFDLGFVQGMEQNESQIATAARRTSMIAVNMMSDIMSNINDMDMTPTITPVLNTKDLQNGVQGINMMLNGSSIIASSIGDTFNRARNISLEMNEASARNQDVVSQLIALRSDMYDYTETIASRNVVMDTGVLVGALTPGMDKSLGNNMKRVKRGI